MTSVSMWTGSVDSVSPSSLVSRVTWVSTGSPGSPKPDAQHHVGRLAAHARQGDQILHGVRDRSAEALVEGRAQTRSGSWLSTGRSRWNG